MQKYIKKVKGKNNKVYTVKKYLTGSNSHHFNKRRLKKVSGVDYFMREEQKSQYKNFYPSGVSIRLNPTVTKHRYNFTGENMAYNDWRNGSLGVAQALDTDSNKEYWKRIDKLDKEDNDKTAQKYINGYDDILDEYVDKTIINPNIHTVSQFINQMFSKYNTVVHITDAKGNSLKYWHLTELNGFHHCPDDSMRWLSQRTEHRDGYTAQNIKWGIKHNSLKHIKLDEEYVPAVTHDKNTIILFELWGDIGVNYDKIQNYLKNKYNIIPFSNTTNWKKLTNYLNRFIKTGKVTSFYRPKSNLISRVGDYSEVNALVKKYQGKNINGKEVRIIPVKFILPNQHNIFEKLRRKYLKETNTTKLPKSELMMIKYKMKRNQEMEVKDGFSKKGVDGGQLVKHSLAIYANLPKRLYQGLNWMMHNKRFEVDKDSLYEDTDKASNLYRWHNESGLNKILSTY